jgi:hypothetical protein
MNGGAETLVGKPEEKRPLEDEDGYGCIMLKLISKR